MIGVIGGAGMGSRLHGNDEWEPGMGSPYRVRGRLRLHGNDGGGLGSRGWVPVCTGTTVVGGWFLYAAPTGGRTRGSAPTAGHARIPLIAFLTRTAPGRAGFKPAPTGGDLGDWSDLGEREGLSESGFWIRGLTGLGGEL